MTRRAVFLDRDGTLNEDVGYPGSFEQIPIFPGSFEAVRRAQRGRLPRRRRHATSPASAAVSSARPTSRSCIAGWPAAFASPRRPARRVLLLPALRPARTRATAVDCPCRKPRPGLALRAAADLDLDLARSYMIGDKPDDVIFGRAIGATPILVLTGYGTESRGDARWPGPDPVPSPPTPERRRLDPRPGTDAGPMIRFDDILDKVSARFSEKDTALLQEGLRLLRPGPTKARSRRSGEPYLSHPLEVATCWPT